MKKIKLNLNKLTIQNLSNEAQQKVKGGIYTIQYHPCNTNEDGCIYETEWPAFC
jgi:Ribosomally synthesized peptide in Bacteroidetes